MIYIDIMILSSHVKLFLHDTLEWKIQYCDGPLWRKLNIVEYICLFVVIYTDISVNNRNRSAIFYWPAIG